MTIQEVLKKGPLGNNGLFFCRENHIYKKYLTSQGDEPICIRQMGSCPDGVIYNLTLEDLMADDWVSCNKEIINTELELAAKQLWDEWTQGNNIHTAMHRIKSILEKNWDNKN